MYATWTLKRCSLDTNVLVYANVIETPFHEKAKRSMRLSKD